MAPTGSDHIVTARRQMQEVEALQVKNNALKDALSDILAHNLEDDLLEQLETCQTGLINKDLTLSLLRHEIAQLPLASPGSIHSRLQKDIHTMSRDIATMKANIAALKTRVLVSHLRSLISASSAASAPPIP